MQYTHKCVRTCITLIAAFILLWATMWSKNSVATTHSTPQTVLTLNIATYNEHLIAFNEVVTHGQCPSFSFLEQSPHTDNQVLLEFIFMCNALKEAGIKATYKFIGYPVLSRLVTDLPKQNQILAGFGIWQSKLDETDYFITEPLIAKGDFHKGLYVESSNHRLLSLRDLNLLKNYTAATNQTWQLDSDALNCITKKQVHFMHYQQMYKAVNAGRADFILKTFTTEPQLRSTLYGYDLMPIPNIKVTINDAIVFAVPKAHFYAKELIVALNKGLSKLNERGIIRRYYNKMGILNDNTEHWVSINCANEQAIVNFKKDTDR